MIKEKAFDRLSYDDKNNIKIINFKNEVNYSLKDMLLVPIIIKSPANENISEKVLKKYILDELRDFFLQLGSGFLFNTNLNCYIPVELKLNSTNYKDVSQIQLYRKIIDSTVKKKNHNKSIGLIISKQNDNFIFKYVNDDGVYLISYNWEKVI